MMNSVEVNGADTNLSLPDGFQLVETKSRERNGETVQVERYQKDLKVTPNNAHVTVVWGDDGRLISYNNFAVDEDGQVPTESQAVDIAWNNFEQLDPDYASGLQFMRVDHYTRYFINSDGERVDIPIAWVKFAHAVGEVSYNWVSVGVNGQVIEMERESYWDYFASRRATEEWNYDDWVLARQGKGPQLKAPEARA
ncbi:hypothetical protein [Furfurilactobacillus siliginis]|uniref:Uncharacterized protein n=1 Tax=Furfurilactobacillus siliginis TaxID=348151 RepID=A0A0R2LDT4_9LACO|nr:hypothetical protein [Furfurilactobacillus siliginis]KRN97210.1 hypothetical protein IV55_GL000133 [Furfurilactobacillus siliginis]GEK29317.1 hypothetical protein LSI01_16280 [Furfurilactobacillus siliginis]